MMRPENRQTRTGCVIEGLEGRRLLSISPMIIGLSPIFPTAISLTSSPGVVLREQAGTPFTARLGTFVTLAPGNNLQAQVTWGDGTSSQGTVVPASVVGIDEIQFEVVGSHTYGKAGLYPITVVVTQPGPTPTSLVKLIATLHDSAIVSVKQTNLNGTIKGTYSLAPTAADIGAGYVFDGTGTAGDLGDVAAHGLVTLPGFITTGQAMGKLTLTQSNSSASPVLNSVTLSLIGPIEPGFGPFPSTLTYTITSGTGAFAGASGSGTIAVTLNSDMTFAFAITSLVTATPLI